jgi:hypothetical protein
MKERTIDDDGNAELVAFGEDSVQQSGFSSAQRTRKDGDGTKGRHKSFPSRIFGAYTFASGASTSSGLARQCVSVPSGNEFKRTWHLT